jgi:hypothetical protein
LNAPPFRIEIRPLLIGGMVATEPSGAWWLLLDAEQEARQKAISLWHETVHLLMFAAGLPAPQHDEQQIEAIAVRLAAACPDILQILKLSKEPPCPTTIPSSSNARIVKNTTTSAPGISAPAGHLATTRSWTTHGTGKPAILIASAARFCSA